MKGNHRSKDTESSKKMRRQISVYINDELHARIRAACQIQRHDESQLCRILIEWALPFYEEARSVEVLERIGKMIKTSGGLEHKPYAELPKTQSAAAD